MPVRFTQPADWRGVMPAITTPLTPDLSVDHHSLAKHARWLIDAGCTGIVLPGSLGEGATLSAVERREAWETVIRALDGRAATIAAIASASTADACRQAQAAFECGCGGLMVLPPYVYRGCWDENRAHFAAVFDATPLSCMLYNNPAAYGVDLLPEQIVELSAAHANLHAVKESSGDVRRITALRAAACERLGLLVGLDDLVVEGVAAGARGWIAGLVNALPRESVALFSAALEGDTPRCRRLYEWFLPLLRMDTRPEFVQLIKLVQAKVGMGSERVRPPRLPVTGAAREAAERIIEEALRQRPGM